MYIIFSDVNPCAYCVVSQSTVRHLKYLVSDTSMFTVYIEIWNTLISALNKT